MALTESQKRANRKYKRKNRKKLAEQSRLYREQNPEKVKETQKKSVEKNKQYYLNTSKKYYEENKEHCGEVNKEWRQNNQERVLNYNRNYYLKNAEELKAKNKTPKGKFNSIRYSAKKRNLLFELSFDTYELQFYCAECAYCGQFNNGGVDRISSDEGYVDKNMVPCCILCNQAKNNLSVSEFRDLIIRLYHRLDEWK